MRNQNKGEEYINAFPKFKKWINECNVCHRKGYNPNIPEQITSVKGSLGTYYIKKYFSPLFLDERGLCEQCSAAFRRLEDGSTSDAEEI